MSFRKRLNASMRGKKSKSHRLLRKFRAVQLRRHTSAAMVLSMGISQMMRIRSSAFSAGEPAGRVKKAVAMAECVVATMASVSDVMRS